MTREQFMALLVRGVQDKFCTEDEARRLLARFDEGIVTPDLLPLPLEDAIQGLTPDVWKAAK